MNLEVWNPYVFPDAGTIVMILTIGLLLFIAAVLFLAPPCRKAGLISAVLLLFWIFTIISATVLGRMESGTGQMNLTLFWTIRKAWAEHSGVHWYYIIGNVLLFIPLGILLPLTWRGFKHWWSVTLCGFTMSLLIEVYQYAARIGLCELDDVFHNTLGTLIGFQIYLIFYAGYTAIFRPSGDRGRNYSVICPAVFLLGIGLALFVLLYLNRPDWTGIWITKEMGLVFQADCRLS